MRPVLFAVLFGIAAVASAAPYSCPPSLGPSQVGCTFTSTGGTTTYTANVSAQATRKLPEGNSLIVLQVSLDALPCFSNFDAPVPISTTANVNGSCTFDVTSKRPVDLVAVAQYFNATPTYISLVATSIAFVSDYSLVVSIVGDGTVSSPDGGISCGSVTPNACGSNVSSIVNPAAPAASSSCTVRRTLSALP